MTGHDHDPVRHVSRLFFLANCEAIRKQIVLPRVLAVHQTGNRFFVTNYKPLVAELGTGEFLHFFMWKSYKRAPFAYEDNLVKTFGRRGPRVFFVFVGSIFAS